MGFCQYNLLKGAAHHTFSCHMAPSRIHVEKFFILIVYQFEMALCMVINLYRNHEWAKNVEIKSENVQMAHIKYMWTGVLYIWIAAVVNKCLGWTAFISLCNFWFGLFHVHHIIV